MTITDAEWREFRAIPSQGYSHRHWVDCRIRERAEAAWDACIAEIDSACGGSHAGVVENPYRKAIT